MKSEYNEISLAMLVDLLAQETEKLTHMMYNKTYGPEYEETKKNIHELTAAIEAKQKLGSARNGDRRYNPDPSGN